MKRVWFFVLLIGMSICARHDALAQTPEQATSRFKELDRNGDGKLAGDEIANERVRRFDGNRDGTITLDEALKVLSGAVAKEASTFESSKQPSTTATANGGQGKTVLDVRYRETLGIDANDQSLDIYAPENASKAPVLAYVHGGGWAKGDKKNVDKAPAFFNQHGFVYVSINYRLLPAGKHPNNVDDVASAMAWIHSNIAQYGGDPEQLFLYGHSAGAHLVALLATDERRLKAAGKDLTILKGVIPLDTNAYDIPKLIAVSDASSTYAKVFGSDPATLQDAAPSWHVAPNKGIPPMLIFHSNTGFELRNAQATAFVAILRGAKVTAELIPSPDQTHGEINQQFGTPGNMVTEAAMKFFDRYRIK